MENSECGVVGEESHSRATAPRFKLLRDAVNTGEGGAGGDIAGDLKTETE